MSVNYLFLQSKSETITLFNCILSPGSTRLNHVNWTQIFCVTPWLAFDSIGAGIHPRVKLMDGCFSLSQVCHLCGRCNNKWGENPFKERLIISTVPWGIRISTWIHGVHLVIFSPWKQHVTSIHVKQNHQFENALVLWNGCKQYLFCSCCMVLYRLSSAFFCLCPSRHLSPCLGLGPFPNLCLCPALALCLASQMASQLFPLLHQLKNKNTGNGHKMNHCKNLTKVECVLTLLLKSWSKIHRYKV